jgi:protein-S-isoprenylcysteine O-methyltransferase Ste14
VQMDTLFHLVFVFAFVSFFALRLYFHWRARTWQREERHPESGAIRLVRLFLVLPFLGLSVAYLFRPDILAFASLPLSDIWRWLGAVLTLAALPLAFWVHISLGRNFSTDLRIRPEHTLVTSGPYAYVRHPMYSVFFVLFTGFLLLTANIIIGGIGLPTLVLVMLVRIPREEQMLLATFGDQYRDYMQRTGRLLPRF